MLELYPADASLPGEKELIEFESILAQMQRRLERRLRTHHDNRTSH